MPVLQSPFASLARVVATRVVRGVALFGLLCGSAALAQSGDAAPVPGTLGLGDPGPPLSAPAAIAPADARPAIARATPRASALSADWRNGAFAEIFVRAYRDSDGDGIGDLRGLTASLDHLQQLGVRGLWLMPVMPSQDRDHGYATTDYRGIEPAYGTLADFDALLAAAHARGIGVIIDYVVNHSAAAHPHFQAALRDRASPYRSWYVWKDAPEPGWKIWDKDPWNTTPTGAYLSVFSPTMPDFDFREPAVLDFHAGNLRFWLDRGVDGFRFDAVSHLVENGPRAWRDQPESRAMIGKLRDVVDDYPNRYVVCEATREERAFAAPDVCGGAFSFHRGENLVAAAKGDAAALAKAAEDLRTAPPGMATMLANHDLFAGDRLWNQFAGDVARYKLAAASILLLPGTPFVYYGEEVGMAAAATLKGDPRLRTPMSWSGDAATAGFTTGTPFRVPSENVATQNVAAERDRPEGLLAWYQALLRTRNAHPVLASGRVGAPVVDGLAMAVPLSQANARAVVLLNHGLARAPLSLGGFAAGQRYRQVFPAGDADATVVTEGGALRADLPAQSVRVLIAE
jgi:alpha-amylase